VNIRGLRFPIPIEGGAFPGKRDCDGAANAAVPAGDDRLFASELSRAPVTVFAAIRNGIHLGLHTGWALLLRRKAHCDFPFRDRRPTGRADPSPPA
jgi:hypothetical protein